MSASLLSFQTLSVGNFNCIQTHGFNCGPCAGDSPMVISRLVQTLAVIFYLNFNKELSWLSASTWPSPHCPLSTCPPCEVFKAQIQSYSLYLYLKAFSGFLLPSCGLPDPGWSDPCPPLQPPSLPSPLSPLRLQPPSQLPGPQICDAPSCYTAFTHETPLSGPLSSVPSHPCLSYFFPWQLQCHVLREAFSGFARYTSRVFIEVGDCTFTV